MEEVPSVPTRIDKELRELFKYVPGEPIVYSKNGVLCMMFYLPENYPFKEPEVRVPGFQVFLTKGWSPAHRLVDIWNDFVNQPSLTNLDDILAYANSEACKTSYAFVPI